MSLLKQLVTENGAAGATGAGAIAGVRGSLFGGGLVQPKVRNKKRPKRTMSGFHVVGEGVDDKSQLSMPTAAQIDPADVLSKLSASEKKAKNAKDTVTFGLEDEEGNLVKVYVKADQAEEFEKALAHMLSSMDDDQDDENSPTEIAEVLFKLKDKFEIVDVEWPTIEGDEEEEQEVQDGDQETGDQEMTADGGEGDDLDAAADELGGEGDLAGDEESAKSALQQVIDMMKADAEAKKAEAEAKTAEYKAKEAELATQAAAAKVKQEEDILDMEAYYKDKSDEDKEAKRLAKLAKYKHDLAKDGAVDAADVSPEEEEESSISLNDLASLIMRNLKAN